MKLFMLKRVLTFLSLLLIFSSSDAQLQDKTATYYNAGIDFRNKKMIPEAIQSFEAAINADKKFDSAYVELGNLYMLIGKNADALVSYKKALAINPQMIVALVSSGKIYRNYISNPDSALYFFKTAADFNANNKEVFCNIAWCYNTKMEYDSAIIYGIKSLDLDNNYRPVYGELAFAYRRSSRFADGIAQFKKNLAISTVDLALLYSGYCYTELKDKAGALQQYEALNKINEKMAGALKKVIDKME